MMVRVTAWTALDIPVPRWQPDSLRVCVADGLVRIEVRRSAVFRSTWVSPSGDVAVQVARQLSTAWRPDPFRVPNLMPGSSYSRSSNLRLVFRREQALSLPPWSRLSRMMDRRLTWYHMRYQVHGLQFRVANPEAAADQLVAAGAECTFNAEAWLVAR